MDDIIDQLKHLKSKRLKVLTFFLTAEMGEDGLPELPTFEEMMEAIEEKDAYERACEIIGRGLKDMASIPATFQILEYGL